MCFSEIKMSKQSDAQFKIGANQTDTVQARPQHCRFCSTEVFFFAMGHSWSAHDPRDTLVCGSLWLYPTTGFKHLSIRYERWLTGDVSCFPPSICAHIWLYSLNFFHVGHSVWFTTIYFSCQRFVWSQCCLNPHQDFHSWNGCLWSSSLNTPRICGSITLPLTTFPLVCHSPECGTLFAAKKTACSIFFFSLWDLGPVAWRGLGYSETCHCWQWLLLEAELSVCFHDIVRNKRWGVPWSTFEWGLRDACGGKIALCTQQIAKHAKASQLQDLGFQLQRFLF